MAGDAGLQLDGARGGVEEVVFVGALVGLSGLNVDVSSSVPALTETLPSRFADSPHV